MTTIQVRVIGAGSLLLLMFLTGFGLSRSGKPYGTLVFTLHKLTGVAVGVLLGIMVYQSHQAAPLGPVEILATVVTVLLFVATVAAGGVLSIVEAEPAAVSVMHKVLPYTDVLSTAATLYLLLSRPV